MTTANNRQVGGDHYKTGGEEHWDRVARLNLDYFQGQITKYVERCWDKNGIQDLEKALHFLEKYIELKRLDRAVAIANNRLRTMGDYVAAMPVEVAEEFKVGHPDRKPDGWIGFTYEGGTAEGEHFRCKTCGVRFNTPMHADPKDYHACAGSEPSAAYVNQDGPSA